MAKYDGFQPRLEAMVTELQTEWAEGLDGLAPDRRASIAARIHADPAAATTVRYDRQHTGFARVVTVTLDDVARLDASRS